MGLALESGVIGLRSGSVCENIGSGSAKAKQALLDWAQHLGSQGLGGTGVGWETGFMET